MAAFEATTHNERIKAVYGNYGLWAWLRYWYIDTSDWVTVQLMDKGYYDYDYEEPKERQIRKATDPKKLAAKLARFGIGGGSGAGDSAGVTAEDMQSAASAMPRNGNRKKG